MPEKKRVPVSVYPDTYAAVKDHSNRTGVPIVKLFAIGMTYWLQTDGAARLKALDNAPARMVFPSDEVPAVSGEPHS